MREYVQMDSPPVSPMGKIIIRDGTVQRTIPAKGVVGKIEIDLTGEEGTVTVPDGVRVKIRD